MVQDTAGAFVINVTDAEIAQSTTYGLYFTVMNQTNSTGPEGQPGNLQPTSPLYVINQSIGGWDPMSPPAFGANLTVSYTAWLSNSLANWTLYNASLRYFIPVNVTPLSPTNDSDFRTCTWNSSSVNYNCTINMTTGMNFSWTTKGKTGWDDTGVGTNSSCMTFSDSRPGEESGGNVTVCFRTYDLNLINTNFNNWAPLNSTTNATNTSSIVGINFTANLSFPPMDETATPAGTAGQANQYNVTFQTSMQTNMNMTDKVPNIADAGCGGTTITLDGSTLTCGTNYTIGSLTLNDVTQGSHTISVSYTPAATTTTTTPVVSGGCVGACSTPTPSATARASATAAPSAIASATQAPEMGLKTIDSSTIVKGTFTATESQFELVYTAGANGFYGDLTFNLPLPYSDYVDGTVSITPLPTTTKAATIGGSWAATNARWEKIDLKPNREFKISITSAKQLSKGVISLFSSPMLFSRSRASATQSTATSSPSPTATYTAAGTDYTFAAVILAAVLIAAAYFGFIRKKKL